jgi:hypothetical protein
MTDQFIDKSLRRQFRHLTNHGTVKRDSQEKIPRSVVSEIHCNSTAVKRTDGASAVLWNFQRSQSTSDPTIRCQGFPHIAPAPVSIWRSPRRAVAFPPCLVHRLFLIRSMEIMFLLPARSLSACSRPSYTGSGQGSVRDETLAAIYQRRMEVRFTSIRPRLCQRLPTAPFCGPSTSGHDGGRTYIGPGNRVIFGCVFVSCRVDSDGPCVTVNELQGVR